MIIHFVYFIFFGWLFVTYGIDLVSHYIQLSYRSQNYGIELERVKVRTSENILARCKIKGYHQKVEKRSAHCYSIYSIFFKIA